MLTVFEIGDKDLLGRTGRLYVRSGVVETPALFPVVNPAKQELPVEVIGRYFRQVITNAYILYRAGLRGVSVRDVLGWDGVVMTDSGAYQILQYGEIDVDPVEILMFQRDIGSDIGVILDLPSSAEDSPTHVLLKVEETLRRARQAVELREELGGMLLVGPIQGMGTGLLPYSAKEMAELGFDIYALGSPTTYMEAYRLDEVVKAILVVRSIIPGGKPLHLFGAGHPLTIPLAVAAGVDMFDSASYILYARDGRVMLRDRTVRLSELEAFPCSTRLCQRDPRDVAEMPSEERVALIAEHNLAILRETINEVRQRISEGTLWEYLEELARAHPAVRRALDVFRAFRKLVERRDPVTHPDPRGLTFYWDTSVLRPEPYRHMIRLVNNYEPPRARKVVVARLSEKPFDRHWMYGELAVRYDHVVFYDDVFGPVPEEVAEVYPLSQHDEYGESEFARALAYEYIRLLDPECVDLIGVDLRISKPRCSGETPRG